VKKGEFIERYEFEQSSMNSPSFIVFNYYLEGGVDLAHYTTKNTLFNAESKNLQLHCIFFEDGLCKPQR
jgi:tRNA A37 threonylcarbamoyladenosine biosynthesis protein TsaE